MKRTLAAAAALGVGLLVSSTPAASASDSSPWTDPSANGTITFCDQQGHAISSGRVTDKPFAWKAVGSAAAPAPFAEPGAVAQLYFFNPIKGSDPGSWIGESLSGASNYSDVAHPAATSTSLDLPLSVFLSDYKMLWDGYIQARLVYSRAGYGAAPQYAAATILVSGDTWQVVGPEGTAPCSSGSAVSDEINALHLPASGIAPTATPSRGSSTAPTASPGKYGTADDPVSPSAASADPGTGGSSHPMTQPGSSAAQDPTSSPEGSSGTADRPVGSETGEALAAAVDAGTTRPWVTAVAIAIPLGVAVAAGFVLGRRRGGHQ